MAKCNLCGNAIDSILETINMPGEAISAWIREGNVLTIKYELEYGLCGTNVEMDIPIIHCPICGRKLKDGEQ